MSRPALEVRDLATHFTTRAGVLKAVDGVSFDLAQGEVVGLVGESGSGKTRDRLLHSWASSIRPAASSGVP